MISVIIPIYNVEKYLNVCLNSFLKQTYQDFEIICVDDASTDSSLEILEYFTEKDSKIKLLKNESNKGLDFSKSRGLKVAQGDFIYFLNDLGWINFNAFELLMENMEMNNLDFIVFKNMLFDYESKSFKEDFNDVNFMNNLDAKCFNPNELEDYLQFLISNIPFNKFYSKSFLIENNIQFDSEFSRNVFRSASNISFLNVSFYNKFTQTLSKNSECSQILNDFIKEFLPIVPWNDNGLIQIIDINPLIIFKLLDNIEELLVEKNIFNYFKNAFFEFKVNNLVNYFILLSNNDKTGFYNRMKEEFVDMKLSFEYLNNLPFELYKFYIKVLNYDYEKFMKFNKHYKINYSYIIKKDLTEKIENFSELGINTQKRDESIIVSLTSFPERLFDIHFCLYSLLNQTLKPDKVILYLAHEEFPNGEEDIPQNVLNLKKNGLTIKWCDNLHSFKKLIPALEEYPDEYIVTVDDDIFYPEDLLQSIWDTHKKYPNSIISSRTRCIQMTEDGQFDVYNTWNLADKFADSSFLNFCTCGAGCLFFPNALSDMVFEKELFEKLCPTGDDIWFWAMAVLNKTKITGNFKPHNRLKYVNISREVGIDNGYTLWNFNQHGQNDIQFKNVLQHFPEILKIIREGY